MLKRGLSLVFFCLETVPTAIINSKQLKYKDFYVP